jgi:hypothetical protein
MQLEYAKGHPSLPEEFRQRFAALSPDALTVRRSQWLRTPSIVADLHQTCADDDRERAIAVVDAILSGEADPGCLAQCEQVLRLHRQIAASNASLQRYVRDLELLPTMIGADRDATTEAIAAFDLAPATDPHWVQRAVLSARWRRCSVVYQDAQAAHELALSWVRLPPAEFSGLSSRRMHIDYLGYRRECRRRHYTGSLASLDDVDADPEPVEGVEPASGTSSASDGDEPL